MRHLSVWVWLIVVAALTTIAAEFPHLFVVSQPISAPAVECLPVSRPSSALTVKCRTAPVTQVASPQAGHVTDSTLDFLSRQRVRWIQFADPEFERARRRAR